jgi:hypothetical protein
MTSRGLGAAARLGALAGVGVVLLATSPPRVCNPLLPPEQVAYDVTSDCGPPGRMVVQHAELECWGQEGDAPVEAAGAEAVGLPGQGELIDPPPGVEPGYSRGIAAGDFALVGRVELPGAVPPLAVERVCRFIPAEQGSLEVICIGPAPEAHCGGTLSPAPEQP